MIKKNILDRIPHWYKNISKDKQYLVLTNDFDSYFSCCVLHDLFKIRIGGFYDFNTGLWLIKEQTEGKEPIFVDLAITKGKAFDNHMTYIDNPQAVNPNVITSAYYKKYNGGTLPFICSLYGIDISTFKQNYLNTLLTIDGWFAGYFNKGGQFKNINIFWMEELGYSNTLLSILENHDRKYFENYTDEYNINEHINIKDGYLQCPVDIKLSQKQFELVLPVKKVKATTYDLQYIDTKTIVTSAECFKDKYMLNVRKEG